MMKNRVGLLTTLIFFSVNIIHSGALQRLLGQTGDDLREQFIATTTQIQSDANNLKLALEADARGLKDELRLDAIGLEEKLEDKASILKDNLLDDIYELVGTPTDTSLAISEIDTQEKIDEADVSIYTLLKTILHKLNQI